MRSSFCVMLMSLFIAERLQWMLRLFFSSVRNVMSVSMFTSLFALWGCYLIVFVFFGQVLSPHHSETNIEHVCKFHISCIGASGCTGKMEKYFTRSLGSHTDSGWAGPGFAFIWNALPDISPARWYHHIRPGGIMWYQPRWNMPSGFRSTLISLQPFNNKPTQNCPIAIVCQVVRSGLIWRARL